MKVEDIQKYLPKYLSQDSQKDLFDDIRKFVSEDNSYRLFTSLLESESSIFQGDGLGTLKYYSFEQESLKDGPGIVLSNTCDISLENERYFPSQIMYSPIINLDKYVALLEKNGVGEQKLRAHIKAIKSQEITQIFYIPTIDGKFNESIVFLDRISNRRNSKELSEELLKDRIFTLSNFGFYLFLLKMSIHFTRIREGVDRKIA